MNWPLIAALTITAFHIWAVWSLIIATCSNKCEQNTDEEDYD